MEINVAKAIEKCDELSHVLACLKFEISNSECDKDCSLNDEPYYALAAIEIVESDLIVLKKTIDAYTKLLGV